MSGELFALVFGYVVFGMLAGVIAGVEIGDHAAAGEAPAIGFVCGLFWPLTVTGVTLWLAFVGARAVAVSFATLWRRRVRPATGGIPKATAKERL